MKFLLHHTISRAMINVMLLIKATTQLYTKNGKYLSCVYAAMTTADAAPATTEHIYFFHYCLLFGLNYRVPVSNAMMVCTMSSRVLFCKFYSSACLKCKTRSAERGEVRGKKVVSELSPSNRNLYLDDIIGWLRYFYAKWRAALCKHWLIRPHQLGENNY